MNWLPDDLHISGKLKVEVWESMHLRHKGITGASQT